MLRARWAVLGPRGRRSELRQPRRGRSRRRCPLRRGLDCSAYVYFVNACAAVAEAPDGSLAWAWGVDLADAEQSAVNGLGLRAPKFPSTGLTSPGPAHVALSVCTDREGAPRRADARSPGPSDSQFGGRALRP
ncbi:DUF4189 domain-containing protein [Nocardia sp. NPDC052278]|uniref:DUF4189 domain-containing protein n=1 Tax=unclassified Nocardia TaxID=2637762 RepID=UPI00368D24D7